MQAKDICVVGMLKLRKVMRKFSVRINLAKNWKDKTRQDKIQEFSYIVNKSIGNRDNTVQFLCVNEEERKRNNNKHRANTIIVIKTRFVNHLDRIYNKNNK